jgi:hypothetical protein
MDTMSDSQQQQMGGDSIPNFLMLDQIPANYLQQIETDLLEPVVFTQGSATTDGFCRFTLQNKGFLHSHSKIFLSVSPEAGIADGFFSPNAGIGQIIKKAVLKIGNKTLNEIDGWNQLYSMKSAQISNENNTEREMFTTGRWLAHQFEYNPSSSVLADTYSLDTGLEISTSDYKLPAWYVMNTAKPTEVPTFMIDLSDLFPFLKVNQLPLYMIKEPINIELHFQPNDGKRIQRGSTDSGVSAIVTQTDVKFCADYVFYGASDEMARYAAANKDMSFSFVDYRLVENTTDHTALGSTVIRNLGMANRIVPRILTCLPSQTHGGVGTILGQQNSIAPFTNASGVQSSSSIRYNVRYNDRFEYTSDVDSVARLFAQLTQSEGVPFITRAEYSNQSVNAISDDTLFAHEMRGNLVGQMFYLGTRLTNGRVGQRGIELHLSGVFPSSGRTIDLLRTYCEYVRVARLSDGYLDIYNA